MLADISHKLHVLLATDQSYHAKQMPDGNYKTTPGLVTPRMIKDCILKEESIAIYQKNKDSSVKWICFDFDVLKKHIGKESYLEARESLNNSLEDFCKKLENISIPYFLEFSGNRGFHVWVTLDKAVSYNVGYQIQQSILRLLKVVYNSEYVGIDFFPSSASPTSGVGKCVKLPLSKHKKSGKYSSIICSLSDISTVNASDTLTQKMKEDALYVLDSHESLMKPDIEELLGVFELMHEEEYYSDRVRKVKIEREFTIDELKAHWEKNEPLKNIMDSLFNENRLSNEQRMLFVGIFCNVSYKNKDFGNKILHEIFSYTSNYDSLKSDKAISSLSSYYFPSQQQIESQGDAHFKETLDIEGLIRSCIPNYISHEQATFDMSHQDIEITRRAELNYLFQNDEAQARLTVDQLAVGDNQDFFEEGKAIIANPQLIKFYRHDRNEGDKVRTLVSLKAPGRVVTSCILKQLIHFYRFDQNTNSHGYQANKGFSDGYIFKPWLYLWIQFVSNISSALEDENNKDFYVVKTDIKSYYENIPHDNLKRLMLGGVNKKIDTALASLNESSRIKYTELVDSLFKITSIIVNENKGMPQGPAYARYMAEIYLDNLDRKLEEKIQNSEIFLYQRYVDDIFFIAETKETANTILSELEEELSLLGLRINRDKTKVVKVIDFSHEFDQYKSQSKYAVDSVSKDFNSATDAQKDLAINEFISLIESDKSHEDLSFIFSHLPNVPLLDKLKREKVLPVLKSGLGRGSLYKHLFTFIFETKENWSFLFEVEKYNSLQSEVFTATAINFLENAKSNKTEFCELIENLQSKLASTELTDQHLVYMTLRYKVNFNIEVISDDIVIECLRDMPDIEHAYIPTNLVEKLNTKLNDIKSLSDFVNCLYPLCACLNTPKEDLEKLAQTFYSKLSVAYSQGQLSDDSLITKDVTASKFYYLICLFSLSSANSSTDLLKEMWQFCAITFNKLNYSYDQQRIANWFERLEDIQIDEGKALLIISSIVDGNIYRGHIDRTKSFKYFHNIVLLYFAYGKKLSNTEDIVNELEKLRGLSYFYDWIIDNSDVHFFPNNKHWFEENVIKNNCISLRKSNELLFRRPLPDSFLGVEKGAPTNSKDGYIEKLVPYDTRDVVSIKDAVDHNDVVKSINLLLNLLDNSCEMNFPNIFSQAKMLSKETLLPFNEELSQAKNLIFEDCDKNVITYKNSMENFVKLFFMMALDGRVESDIGHIEKYIRNLRKDIDLLVFIKHASTLLTSFKSRLDVVLYDIGFATALDLCLGQTDPIVKISQFVKQYHIFNSQDLDKHIYSVSNELIVTDETPLDMLDTVIASLGSVNVIFPHLPFSLKDDVVRYREIFIKSAKYLDTGLPIDTASFSKANHRISQVTEKITLNNMVFNFEDILIINLMTGATQRFEPRYAVFLNSAEHVYFSLKENTAYIVVINNEVSKIFRAIEYRAQMNIPDLKDYPPTITDEISIKAHPQFEAAVKVIAIHQDISEDEASCIAVRWLCGLPEKFHSPLIALISAHTSMKEPERHEFVTLVKRYLDNADLNIFLIKDLKDHNGTHRVLYTDSDLGRRISACSPLSVSENATQATVVLDALITGSQIIRALNYYINKKGRDQNYFVFNDKERGEVSRRFKSLKKLNICVILYTDEAIDKISSWCQQNISNDFEVEVICGRNVGDDAFFSSSTSLGEQDKDKIYRLVNQESSIKELFSYLKSNRSGEEVYINCNINRFNLIARYKSLPKKCFTFLCLDLKNGAPAPFKRITELYEMSPS